ncbi:MAG TPA: MAE_28990/MAE_18760 family HEPN-like nuclease [Vicinamibacterales bacterium]|nr:MAE_28990/MAE_18760 family HEPN-like nuclease [Vicinamibacterales bacterium]
MAKRIHHIRLALNEIDASIASAGHPKEVALNAKGLIFVQLYAVYEYCVNAAFQAALSTIRSHLLTCDRVHPELISLALHPAFEGLADTPKKSERWLRRAEIVRKAISADPLILGNTFPGDENKMRVEQVETVFAVLRVAQPAVNDPRLPLAIKELVELRNGVAHGLVSADEIGKRFSIPDLAKRTDDMERYCNYVLAALEEHVTDPANLHR